MFHALLQEIESGKDPQFPLIGSKENSGFSTLLCQFVVWTSNRDYVQETTPDSKGANSGTLFYVDQHFPKKTLRSKLESAVKVTELKAAGSRDGDRLKSSQGP